MVEFNSQDHPFIFIGTCLHHSDLLGILISFISSDRRSSLRYKCCCSSWCYGMSLLSLLLLFKQKGQRIEKENNANQFTKRELGPRLYCQVQNLMLLFTGEILAGFQHLHPWLEYKPDEINAERFDGAYRGSMDAIFNGGWVAHLISNSWRRVCNRWKMVEVQQHPGDFGQWPSLPHALMTIGRRKNCRADKESLKIVLFAQIVMEQFHQKFLLTPPHRYH